jgi:hypothetical protein
MSTTSPTVLDDKLVKAFTKSLNKTHETLSKYTVNGVTPDQVPVKDRVGVWCTHLRRELFMIGDCSRQHAIITDHIAQTSQWDDVGVVRKTYERKVRAARNYEGWDNPNPCWSPIFPTIRADLTKTCAYTWLLKAHGAEGEWRMSNERLAELVKKAKRSPDFATALYDTTQEIKTGMKEVESDLSTMFDLLQEFNTLNVNADKVVDDLCKVAEAMVA